MKTKKRPRKRILLAVGILVVCALIWVFLRPEKAPAKRIEGLWAKRGVANPNVIPFTLDTTRADHIACYGYRDVKTPNLDALADRGILFEQAATSSPLTLPAHCSIMTGMYPTYHGVRVNGNAALSQEQTTIADYTDYLSRFGMNLEILNLLGTAHYQKGNTSEALRACKRSLEVNPNQENVIKLVQSIEEKAKR